MYPSKLLNRNKNKNAVITPLEGNSESRVPTIYYLKGQFSKRNYETCHKLRVLPIEKKGSNESVWVGPSGGFNRKRLQSNNYKYVQRLKETILKN